MNTQLEGVLCAAGAFLLWGLLPVYWKLLKAIPAPTLLCHRIIWSALFYFGVVLGLKKQREVSKILRSKSELKLVVIAGVLVGVNWLIYIYAINSNHVLEASMGYFLTPLANVFLGFFVLGENLASFQWAAVGLAALGVVNIARVGDQRAPLISLALAITFGCYGLIKKKTRVLPSVFSWLETMTLFLPAIAYLIFFDSSLKQAFSWPNLPLVILSGIVTGVPLLLFARAANHLTLSTIGFMQYISPTLQFSLAVFFYREPFTQAQRVGFSCIWIAIATYLVGAARLKSGRQRVTMSQLGANE
jgi:chloramphenicol-sensitive protein RarD